ncbi:Rieske 2Fe-2S domain-containing protein [Streptomyces formicae]|uniref:cholesterol 7-desaturase n=1 Tax=Streptomyces formicae TaxID=1616117 RepID=A0A291QEY3_9ACTN|nr:Rieske 2Fe-2S domain-containing protein [Streptomyces formicae]ATL29995.1 Vanillate O-demethylase oxygenase subunit [Streptomyces formicae]
MTAAVRSGNGDRHSGYDATWFAAAHSKNLKHQQIVNTVVCEKKVTLYRTADGVVHAINPVCPHLGASLGHGRVEGDNIRCPFHGLAFNPEGRCVEVPWGAPPIRPSVQHYRVHENNGFIYVWVSETEPAWTPLHLDRSPFTYAVTWEATISASPRDMVENAPDYQHFAALHTMEAPRRTAPTVFEKHVMSIRLNAAGFWVNYPTLASLNAEGTGLIHAHVTMPRTAFRLLEIVTQTPADQGTSVLRVATYANATTFLKGAARKGADRLVSHLAHWGATHQMKRDIFIWAHRVYPEHAHLTKGEEDIAALRRWMRQFDEAAPQPDPPPAA